MNPFVKRILEKQLTLLAEHSANLVTNGDEHSDLYDINAQMVTLAKILAPELRNLSYAASLNTLPDGRLTISDLEGIAAARKEQLRRADEELRRLLDEAQKTKSAPHLESACTLSAQT